jgi:hypothetical protein
MTRVTEGTVNSKMEAYLSKHGFSAESAKSGYTKDGRRQPDFEINQGGDYYGEGEWIDTYLTGYHQAMEFGNIPGASGYFVIGWSR